MKAIFSIYLFVVITLGILTMGCLEGSEDKLSITARLVEHDEGDPDITTYHYLIDEVGNGQAIMLDFRFRVTDANGNTVLDEKADFAGLDGMAIQFADMSPNVSSGVETVDATDFFIIVLPGNYSGGTLNVYYEDDVIHEFVL